MRRLASIAGGALVVTAIACGPPPTPAPPPLVTHHDSLMDSEARAHGPVWRDEHYPAADPHGPFARPALPAGQDTNDPVAYFRLGDSLRYRQAGVADRAYYWATRLDPTFADAWFARWRLRRRDWQHVLMPDGSIRNPYRLNPEAAIVDDSLLEMAVATNPFMRGAFDPPAWVARLSDGEVRRDHMLAGLRAYARGDFRAAASEFGALEKEPQLSARRIPRAFAFVRLDEGDSAIAELSALAARIDAVQRDSISMPYFSRDMLYYAIGLLHARAGRMAAARRAYESAIAENFGFFMGHARLSAAALAVHDTAAAVTELQMATMIRDDDPLILAYYGELLYHVRRYGDAEREVRAAIRADSAFAYPYITLGLILDAERDTAAARASYEAYRAHASRGAPERAWVDQRLGLAERP